MIQGRIISKKVQNKSQLALNSSTKFQALDLHEHQFHGEPRRKLHLFDLQHIQIKPREICRITGLSVIQELGDLLHRANTEQGP